MKTTPSLVLFLALALLGFVSLALSAPTAHAQSPTIVRVMVDGATSGSCGNLADWSNACGLQHALKDVAVSGDELWVAAGTYTPTMGLTRADTFQLRVGIALYGGFAGSETLRSQRNFTANVTILSGDLNGNDNSNVRYDESTRSENSFHVVTGSGTNNTAILDGFTVRGGNANSSSYPHYFGGGMLNLSGSPTVANVTFISNSATFYIDNFNYGGGGGGMYNYQSSPALTSVIFSGNTASALTGVGGGIYNRRSSPTLTDLAFSGNSAQEGSGMYNEESSSPTLNNVTFSGNGSTYRGGGMYNDGVYGASNPTLTNVTFSGNTGTRGGGMYNDSSSPTLRNVTFSSNWVSTNGGGMSNNNGSNPIIRNGIFWGNAAAGSDPQIGGTASLYDTVVQGGCPVGSLCTNVITADPRLGPLGNWGGGTATVPLLPGSSAIDAGDDLNCAATDQRGVTRSSQGAHCDLGAFESRGFVLTKMGGDSQHTLFGTAFPLPLQAMLTEIGGNALPGGSVTYTAPSSGASASWSSSATITQTIVTTDSGGSAVSPIPIANAILGSYGATADAPGVMPVTFTLTNGRYACTASLASSSNPSVVGQGVTLTATVAGLSPSGSITFKDGGTSLAGCVDVTLSGASAQCAIALGTAGPHDLTAAYSGDATNDPSTGALTQVVAKANTTTVMTSSENPVLAGHPVTFTVTVRAIAPASGTPTGSVSLYETLSSSAAARQSRTRLASHPLVGGVATITVPALTRGAHGLVAMYDGDANHAASTSAIYTQNMYLVYYYLPFFAATGE